MMKWTGKLVVLLMGMSLWASPLMACMMPDALSTVEERECCKSMAGECGQMEMPASHSCCKAVVRQIDSYLINSKFPTIHSVTMVNPPIAAKDKFLTAGLTHTTSIFQGHSPPVSPPQTNSILRI